MVKKDVHRNWFGVEGDDDTRNLSDPLLATGKRSLISKKNDCIICVNVWFDITRQGSFTSRMYRDTQSWSPAEMPTAGPTWNSHCSYRNPWAIDEISLKKAHRNCKSCKSSLVLLPVLAWPLHWSHWCWYRHRGRPCSAHRRCRDRKIYPLPQRSSKVPVIAFHCS